MILEILVSVHQQLDAGIKAIVECVSFEREWENISIPVLDNVPKRSFY